MAVRHKIGLDYFPLDVDFFSDEKIEFASARFGLKGELIAVKLLCKIYRNGYYSEWSEDDSTIFAKRAGEGFTPTLVNEVVQELVKRGFFNRPLLDRFGILTSTGIQKRYFEAVERRKLVEVFKEYALIDLSKFENVIIIEQNVNISPPNDNILQQSKGEESKVEESKRKPKPADPKKEQITYPFNSENFLEQWRIWKDFKAKEHKFFYKTAQSEQAALNDLIKKSNGIEEIAIAIIHDSMANGWKGFYEPKNPIQNNGQQQPNSNNGKQSTGGHVSADSAFSKIDRMFS